VVGHTGTVTPRNRHLALALCLVTVLAACGDDGSDEPDGLATEPGTSVTGFLVVDAAGTRLCDVLAESFPPQCGSPLVTVTGLDVALVSAPVETTEGVSWTDEPITLRGDRTDDALAVPPAVTGPGISGRATASPICPVETDPPDPACAPRSVGRATVAIRRAGPGGSVLLTVTTDDTGRYYAVVPPGEYAVEAAPVEGLMGTPAPAPVTVRGALVVADLAYDTGIR